ncbi:SLAP domain-containing protein [Solibacillus merdavium]|uniref:SLAP domain-containing protein n=1 Tax=Solibacillus merdavium TaxID=2762218 RepID=A0ABR8XPZ0_9BACL|nr:SLAP domain-containing protein [Solibacillus merdavium]MBD8033975.1 SLAP domain-containing protein [Solibacillus merdavium]
MVQKLQFEAAWDKTIAKQDRLIIEQLFHQTKDEDTEEISCCFVRKALNHRQQLLLTVLIHNRSGDVLNFQNREVTCTTTKGVFAKTFTIPNLNIPPHTSMPWTFIFDDEEEFLFTELLHVDIQ